MHVIAIVVFCVLAATCYGVVHDQITARICVEYFTIGHPPIFVFETESPTLLGFAWGIVATWWVGLILGCGLAFAARAGRRAKITTGQLIWPISRLMMVAALCAFVSGVIGYALAMRDIVVLFEPWASSVPAARHDVFLADLWAHTASYAAGLVGGVVVIVRTWRCRGLVAEEAQ